MRLVTYHGEGGLRLGALLGEDLLDLAQAWLAYRRAGPGVETGVAEAFPEQMLAFLEAGQPAMEAARRAIAWVAARGFTPGDSPFLKPAGEYRLAAPVPEPGKIVCVGLNYLDHCRETGTPIPEMPLLFAKFPSSVIGPGESITWPDALTQQVDYEAELAVVIGRAARFVPASQAFGVIAGYTIVNDVSARDLQFGDGQWVRGKSLDTFCPMGPALVTRDEIRDPQDLAVRCRVNEQVMQDSSTSLMIFPVAQLVEFITQSFTLYPGDLICTGTPHGVGAFRQPPLFLQKGDRVRVAIGGLGELSNPVA